MFQNIICRNPVQVVPDHTTFWERRENQEKRLGSKLQHSRRFFPPSFTNSHPATESLEVTSRFSRTIGSVNRKNVLRMERTTTWQNPDDFQTFRFSKPLRLNTSYNSSRYEQQSCHESNSVCHAIRRKLLPVRQQEVAIPLPWRAIWMLGEELMRGSREILSCWRSSGRKTVRHSYKA